MEGKDIQVFIDSRTNSERYKYFKWGDDYYNGKNTAIMNRKKQVYLGDEFGVVTNPFMANHIIPSNYLQKIVLQLVGYLVGNGVNLDIDNYFDDPFDTVLNKLAITARKKGEAWLYAYVDNKEIKFTEIQPEQLVPIYDKYGKLVKMIKLGQDNLWLYDEKQVTEYQLDKNKKWKAVSTYGHYQSQQIYMGQKINEIDNNFGLVPFIPLYANNEKLSDLARIKPFIDTYDIINSDFANNIDDMQDAFFTLKGYSNNIEDLTEFMKQLKQIKVVPIDEDGQMEKHELNIPVEARKEFLDRLDKDIFKFSMSVDTGQMSGGSLTNVAIKAMYSELDLKADQFETEVRSFLKSLVNFLNQTANSNISLEDLKLDRTMIVNVEDRIEKITKLMGILSDELLLELLPLDFDVEEELERQQQRVRLTNG